VFATYTLAATSPPRLPAFVSADDLDRAVGAYTLEICLCCDEDNASKRLELLLFHNHSNIAPTRRVLCLTPHPHTLILELSQRNTLNTRAQVSDRKMGRPRKQSCW